MTAEANPLMAVPSPTSETSANTSVETPAQRRAKKRFLASPQNATVLCSSGWREVVKEEIVEILQSSYLPQNEKDSALIGYVNTLRDYWVSYFRLRRLTLFDFEKKERLIK